MDRLRRPWRQRSAQELGIFRSHGSQQHCKTTCPENDHGQDPLHFRVHHQTSWYEPKRSSQSSNSKLIKTQPQRPTDCNTRVRIGSKMDPVWTLITTCECL